MSQTSVHRFHVWIGGERTSVSLDTCVADYLAAMAAQPPGTPEGIAAVRTWAQAEIDARADATRPPEGLSRWLMRRALDRLASDNAKCMRDLMG